MSDYKLIICRLICFLIFIVLATGICSITLVVRQAIVCLLVDDWLISSIVV